MPNIVPGCLHPSNGRDSIDWNHTGLIGYASHNVIFVVDAMKMKRIQSLDFHLAAVNVVRWSPARSAFSEQPTPNHAILASSDISGQIIVSNVLAANKINQFSHSNSSVLQMQWYPWKDISRHFLLALHSSNCLVLWNTTTGEKVWTHNYTISLFDFSIDPFSLKNVVFSSTGNKILFTSDIGLSEPCSSGHLFHVTLEESVNNSKDTNIYIVLYHKAYRNVVFVVIGSNLYLINPELMCTLSRIAVESNIIGWLPMSRRDAVVAIHTNGAITLRVGNYVNCDDAKRPSSTFLMEKMAQTECIRHGSSQRIVSATICPTTQATMAVLYQNGKMAFWQLKNENHPFVYRTSFIEDYIEFDEKLENRPIGNLSIHQLAKLNSISTGVTCVRMRPMDELAKVENDQFSSTSIGTLHLAAVGTNSGNIHLVDIFTSEIYREISVQASPIKCLEWAGVYSVLTAGYNHSLSASQVVRNEVVITDIRTGISRKIRPEVDESPVSMIRVSYYHCYLAIAFQLNPLEIWDLESLRLLRRMTRTCPLIVDMAWSNKHHSIKTTEATQQSVHRENLVLLDSENRIYHINIKGLHVKNGTIVNTKWKNASAQICTMAWKNDMLAVGDVEGSLIVWDLGRSQLRQVRNGSNSRVLRMFFSKLAGDHTMAVLNSREVTLWDTEAMTKVQSIRTDAARLFLDADLCGLSPLVLSNDNQLRFLVSSGKNVAILEKDVPILCREEAQLEIRKKLDALMSSRQTTPDTTDEGIGIVDTIDKMESVDGPQSHHIDTIIEWITRRKIEHTDATGETIDLTRIEKEQTLRRFCGDQFAADLLSILIDRFVTASTSKNKLQHLGPDLQMFWSNEDFKERETRVIGIACGAEEAMERRLVEQAVVAGGSAKEKVTDRLIVSADLRYASIKAALLVSSQQNEKAKSLIKLIATNLIASDLIEDGVELLFLVGAGADACKYLQSQKLWTKSIVYGKMGLDDPTDVESKWIAHLAEEAKQTRVLADAARQNWPDVVEVTSSFDSLLARLILRTSTSTPPISSCPTPNL